MKKVISILFVLFLAAATLVACSAPAATQTPPATAQTPPAAAQTPPATPAVAPGDVAGFEEFPLGDDIELGPLNVAGVYFQPVDMEPTGGSLPASESDMHMEADISALAANDLGYGAGDFVPYLTVRYELEAEDGSITEGNFMPMSASDGPHYGANVKFPAAGTYKVRFFISNPEAQGYLLHIDPTTGVEGRFWTGELVAEWDFDFVPRTW
ncbi:MAG: iron transporter [Gracilibacteraceae bacterium]|nr:iron transporter [Gracilibacteraceae bacterium]